MSLVGDIDRDGPVAPPRRNGEVVFDAPWQARAFGLCLAVLEREGCEWSDFRPHLAAAVAGDAGRGYYESVVVALEAFLAERWQQPA